MTMRTTTASFLLIGVFMTQLVGCANFGSARLRPSPGEARYLSNIKQLTFQSMGFVNAGEGYFSPDATQIIFQATPKGSEVYQIYSMNLTGGKPKLVSTGHGACTCAFYHPTKDKIIFASSHLDPDADKPSDGSGEDYEWHFNEHMDIFESDLDGSNLRRLTTADGYDAEGSYSPDGSKIVFCSQRDDDLELYVMNADGSDQRRVTNVTGYDGGPFFSPDGQSILYRADRRDDGKMNLQLRIINVDGTNDRAITDNDIFNWCPYWSPSGKSFIFTQADHQAWAKGSRPNYDLFMLTPSGGEPVRITDNPHFDGLPVFSPDGTKLLWTSKRGSLDEAQLFIADFVPPPNMP